MSQFDPSDLGHRAALAFAIRAELMGLGFVPTDRPGTKELVFSKGSARVRDVTMLVFTSIEGNEVRGVGADSIKVCTVFTDKDGKTRGLGAEQRVFRTGEISGIVSRIRARIVDAAGTLNQMGGCGDCGAPIFITKKGKPCCADLCWSRARRGARAAGGPPDGGVSHPERGARAVIE